MKAKEKARISRKEALKRYRRKHINRYTPGKLAWSLFRAGLLIGLSYVILYPILLKLSVAFMERQDLYDMSVGWIPKHFTLENFSEVAVLMDYRKFFCTAIGMAALSTVIQVISAALAAYGLAKFEFRGKRLIYALVILTMIIPPQTYITASYRQFRYFDCFGLGKLFGMEPISLINTPWPVVMLSVGCVAVKNGMFVFILRQFFRNMPVELDEAAYADGAGPFRIFWQLTLPNAIPALTTVTVFAFVWNWNDSYTASTYMPQMKLFPTELSNLLVNISRGFGVDEISGGGIDTLVASQLANAGALVMQIPILLFFLVTQKFFVEGVERTGLTGM